MQYTPATPKTYFLAPSSSLEEFTGREEYISCVENLLCQPNKHTRVALYGLGGIG